MSNHSGGYMLNNVLKILEKRGYFDTLAPQDKVEFVDLVLRLGMEYDCNSYEILDEIGERLGICYQCRKGAESLDGGLCPKCAAF